MVVTRRQGGGKEALKSKGGQIYGDRRFDYVADTMQYTDSVS